MLTRILSLAALALTALAQDPAAVAPYQVFTFDGQSGQVAACANCSIYTYAAGTSTPLATYTDYTLGTPNTNPVCTNSKGYALAGGCNGSLSGIWVGAACYKFVLKDANAVTIWTQDHLCNQSEVFKALLASSAGSSYIGYKYSSAATARTVQSKLQEALSIVDFGADPTGANDSASAINAAFTAARVGSNGGLVTAPCGLYKVASQVTIPAQQGGDFAGAGKCTIFKWYGNTTDPMFLVASNFQGHFHDFQILGNSGAQLAKGIEISTTTTPISTRNLFENVLIDGVNSTSGYITDGIVADGTNSNNDFHKFINVTVTNYVNCAWYFKGSNSVGHQLIGSAFTQGDYGVCRDKATDATGGNAGGAFQMIGGGGSTRVASFYSPANIYSIYPIRVQDADFEDLGRLVQVTNSIAGRWIFSNVTWQKTGADCGTDFVYFTGSNIELDSLDVSNFSSCNTGLITLTYHNSGGNSKAWMTLEDSRFSNSNQTLADLMGTSDANYNKYLTLRNVVWQDPAGTPLGFYTGGTLSFDPQLTQNIADGATSIAYGSGSVAFVENTGATTIANVTGECTVGQTLTLIAGDALSIIGTSGNILTPSGTAFPLQQYGVYTLFCRSSGSPGGWSVVAPQQFPVISCGSSASCATPATINYPARMRTGTIAFSASTTATVTGIPDFTSSTTYTCTASDPSHTYTSIPPQNLSATSFVITAGTSNSDTWTWVCNGY